MAKLYDFKNGINEKEMLVCAKGVKSGKIVVFPTETVYGIGANALDSMAVSQIFKAKGRPTDNPLIVHVTDKNMIMTVVEKMNEVEEKIIDTFCPGPITIILPRKKVISDIVTCGLDTVGIRMPSHLIAHQLIKMAGVPIAAPSANISGRPSGTNVNDIFEELNDKVDYMIDGGACDIGVESTVVKVMNGIVNILRPGKISPQDFVDIGLQVKLDDHIFKEASDNEKVESPGMKHRHYAPRVQTILVDSHDEQKMIDHLKQLINEQQQQSVCIIGCNEHEHIYDAKKVKEYIKIGSQSNLEEMSKNIFAALRKVDKTGCQICYIEGVQKNGIGIAIMNRLFRACEGKIIEV